jgi:hypothetical protein
MRWSGSLADVPMMETANFGQLQDSAHGGWLDRPGLGRILAERQMSSSPVVVGDVALEDPTEMPLAEDDDMVEAFSTCRANKALRIWILPRASGRGQHLLDAHAVHPTAERLPVDTVAGTGMLGDVEMDHASAVVTEDEEEVWPSLRIHALTDGGEDFRTKTWRTPTHPCGSPG